MKNRYWIDFSKWVVFVNDDNTRSFLSAEVVAGGLDKVSQLISFLVSQISSKGIYFRIIGGVTRLATALSCLHYILKYASICIFTHTLRYI